MTIWRTVCIRNEELGRDQVFAINPIVQSGYGQIGAKGVDILQISQLLAGYPDQASGRRNDPVESGISQSVDQLQQPTLSSGLTAMLRQVASHYNVTEITPREFSDMLDALHQAGALPDEQLQQLARIRVDLDLENIDPDEEVDLVDFYADKLDDLSRTEEDSLSSARSPDARHTEQLLAWMEKFAVIQSSANVSGLDALV